jgi:hypothetical protein
MRYRLTTLAVGPGGGEQSHSRLGRSPSGGRHLFTHWRGWGGLTAGWNIVSTEKYHDLVRNRTLAVKPKSKFEVGDVIGILQAEEVSRWGIEGRLVSSQPLGSARLVQKKNQKWISGTQWWPRTQRQNSSLIHWWKLFRSFDRGRLKTESTRKTVVGYLPSLLREQDNWGMFIMLKWLISGKIKCHDIMLWIYYIFVINMK